MDVSATIEYGRLRDQLFPGMVDADNSYSAEILDGLREKSHNVTVSDINRVAAVVQAVTKRDKMIYAASDSSPADRWVLIYTGSAMVDLPCKVIPRNVATHYRLTDTGRLCLTEGQRVVCYDAVTLVLVSSLMSTVKKFDVFFGHFIASHHSINITFALQCTFIYLKHLILSNHTLI